MALESDIWCALSFSIDQASMHKYDCVAPRSCTTYYCLLLGYVVVLRFGTPTRGRPRLVPAGAFLTNEAHVIDVHALHLPVRWARIWDL